MKTKELLVKSKFEAFLKSRGPNWRANTSDAMYCPIASYIKNTTNEKYAYVMGDAIYRLVPGGFNDKLQSVTTRRIPKWAKNFIAKIDAVSVEPKRVRKTKCLQILSEV